MNRLSAYFALARFDHWFKNVFMLPGILIACAMLRPEPDFLKMIAGFLSTCLISSANYVINEWVDADYDRFHPVKKDRPAVLKSVSFAGILTEYLVFLAAGLAAGYAVSFKFFVTALVFALAGIVYNLRPIRTKDLPVLDVLSESMNNPIRLLLGWYTVADHAFPPSSLLLSYWMAGAFLMNVKRYSEVRAFSDRADLMLYRKSFRVYTEDRLMQLSLFYAMFCAFFLGIFLVKHRVEFVISFPLISVLFAWYLKLGMRPDSPAQHPEKLYRQHAFFVYILCLAALIAALFFFEVPWLQRLVSEYSSTR